MGDNTVIFLGEIWRRFVAWVQLHDSFRRQITDSPKMKLEFGADDRIYIFFSVTLFMYALNVFNI